MRWTLRVVPVLMILVGGLIVVNVSAGSPWYVPGDMFFLVGVACVAQPMVERLRRYAQRSRKP